MSDPASAGRGERAAGRHWWVVAAYAAVSGSNQMLWLTYAPVTTEAAAHYGVTVDAIGWLAELFPLLYVVLALPAGLALDRRLRPSLGLGVALNGVGALLRVAWPAYAGALTGQIMIAVAQPLLLAAVARVVEASVPPPERPRAIGLASAGLFAGMVAALLLGPLVGGTRLPLLLAIQAGLAVVASAALAIALTRPIWPIRPRSSSPGPIPPGPIPPGPISSGPVSPGPAAPGERRWTDPTAITTVLRHPVVRSLIVLAGLGFGVFVAITTWLQALLATAGVSADLAGVMLLVMVVAGILAGVLIPAPVIRSGRAGDTLLAVVAVTVLACGALAVGPGTVVGLLAAAALGLALLGALPVILSLVEARSGAAASTATGLVWLAGNLGGIVVALLVQSALGRPALAFGLMGAVMLAGLPVAVALRRRLRRP